MIVDTSALVAIVFDEPAGRDLFDLVLDAHSVGISAANLVEFSIVVHGRGTVAAARRAERLPGQLGIHTARVTATQANVASNAHRAYGRGSGHPARMNFGDCFAYALAIERDEPLLWVGEDFSHTDVRPAR